MLLEWKHSPVRVGRLAIVDAEHVHGAVESHVRRHGRQHDHQLEDEAYSQEDGRGGQGQRGAVQIRLQSRHAEKESVRSVTHRARQSMPTQHPCTKLRYTCCTTV